MENLSRQSDNIEWSQPQREKCIVINKTERNRRSEKCFDITLRYKEVGVCPACLCSSGPAFPHHAPFSLLQSGNVSLMPYVGSMLSDFFILIFQGMIVNRLHKFQKRL